MNCPECDYYGSNVIDSRPRLSTKSIRRRRECIKCGHRWTTMEVEVQDYKRPITKDGAIKALNAIQDVLFRVAMHSNETKTE